MSKDLLLEVGTEEIPSSYCPLALAQIKERAKKFLIEEEISFSQIKTFGTPRRLVLLVKNLKTKPEKKESEIINHLAKFLPGIITSISFPKSMRWGYLSLRFARPIRWILATFDQKVIKFDLEGIEANHFSFGHRFLFPEKFLVKNFDQYQKELRKRFVIVDPKERKNLIKKQIEELAEKVKGRILPDEKLLETVNWLVEYPVAILGSFKKEFLTLPREVLITAMRYHQKYFSIVNEKGELLPYFITIANIKVTEPRKIIEGNERVLTARLNDAQFLFAKDKKIPLAKRVRELKKITFQEELGSMEEKTKRLMKISEFLALLIEPKIKSEVSRAAFLSKADLTSEMVGEFPELQGVMGGYYAKISGEKEEVCQAISQHYHPRFANDSLPKTKSGSIISIADKIDNLVGYFCLGFLPTSEQDPYALRRQALGLLQIIWENDFQLSLEKLIEKSLNLYQKFKKNKDKIKNQLLDFFAARLENLLETKNFSLPLIKAALTPGFDDLSLVKKRLEALNWLITQPKFESFKLAIKRTANILANQSPPTVNYQLLKEPAEKKLYRAFSSLQKKVKAKIKERKYKEALKYLMEIEPFIHQFFDQVLVMAKDKKLKENRLALLNKIFQLSKKIIAFEKLIS